MSSSPIPTQPGITPTAEPRKERVHQEEKLDEAIEETFPASDPISPDTGAKGVTLPNPAAEDRIEQELDEALEDTFPASDPFFITPELYEDDDKASGAKHQAD